jgi:Lar family restriction alleviation protein
MSECNPCPFCGSEKIEYVRGTSDSEGVSIARTCTVCGAVGPWIQAPDDHVGAFAASVKWNERFNFEIEAQ